MGRGMGRRGRGRRGRECPQRKPSKTDDDDANPQVIPNIFEGAWVVSSAVGNTPALLGNKLTQSYFKGDGYFELDCDVGSSSVASWLVHLIQSYSTQLKIDLAFTIQGNSETELPEKICGALRLCHLDIDAIPFVV